MEKKYIPFNKSMTLDKRNPDFAYQRHNMHSIDGRGMYPSVPFKAITGVPLGGVVKKYVGGRAFVQVGANVQIFNYYGSTSIGTVDYTVTGVDFVDAVDGNDGVHWIASNGDVYKDGTKISTLPHSGGTKIVFDGLYYFFFAKDKIYRQLKSAAETEVFGDTGDRVYHAFCHNDQVFYITENGLDFTISIWGKDDAILLDRRVPVYNARFLAMGVVGGTPIFVTGVGNRTNKKEMAGEIVVSSFDGLNLNRLNSIKAGEEQIGAGNNAYDVGNGIMVVGVQGAYNSHNTDLYNNYVYKITNKGEIETFFDSSLSNVDNIENVSVQYDYITVSLDNGKFYYNIDTRGEDYDKYSDYTKPSIYITPLLDFTTIKHKFGGVGATFEKIFEGAATSESLKISFRVSERDSWTEIDTITKQKIIDNMELRQDMAKKLTESGDDNVGLNVQMYEITKMPDGTPFKEYYEIQFKLESLRGFSVVAFWYYTDAQKRITRR